MKGNKQSTTDLLKKKVKALTNVVQQLIKEVQMNASLAQGVLTAFQLHIGEEEWDKIVTTAYKPVDEDKGILRNEKKTRTINVKKFFKEKDYNLETDGEIKNVNGSAMFVPFMSGVDDDLFKLYLKEILSIDWLHYKLYLVGGILEGWKTTDIDICITGKRDKQSFKFNESSQSFRSF